MGLKNKLKALLADATRMCKSYAGATELGLKIDELATRVDQPLRIAVVGIMKAGKSTLMNALARDKIVFTGNVETTYTVSWFKYGEKPSLRIVFKQTDKEKEAGKMYESQNAPFEDLDKWTVRLKAKENPRIKDVAYIEIYYPNEILKTLELIDTPGLNSSYNLDAKNTLDFLGVKSAEEAKELDRITKKEASQADAIIYAFTRSAGDTDQKLLSQFHGGSLENSSPINALGVYTLSDFTWEPDSGKSAIEITRRITEKTMQHPEMKRLLYATLPVSAKPVEGLVSLTEKEWVYLQGLTVIDNYGLIELIENVPTFTEKTQDEFTDPDIKKVVGTPEIRKGIEDKIGVYGVYEIVNFMKQGMLRSEVLENLYAKTGVKAVNDLIVSHFGSRSLIIKAQFIFLTLKDHCGRLLRLSEDKLLKEICKHILDEIDHIETTEHVFQELKILQSYYNQLFTFNDETEYQEFLQVTGEMGSHCEARLGLKNPMLVSEMADITKDKIRQWYARGNEFGVSRQYEHAAGVIARSYENIHYHLDELSGN